MHNLRESAMSSCNDCVMPTVCYDSLYHVMNYLKCLGTLQASWEYNDILLVSMMSIETMTCF